ALPAEEDVLGAGMAVHLVAPVRLIDVEGDLGMLVARQPDAGPLLLRDRVRRDARRLPARGGEHLPLVHLLSGLAALAEVVVREAPHAGLVRRLNRHPCLPIAAQWICMQCSTLRPA